jgi:demethylmenaquinone methyltransferase / 2-methoxy-6-polyprenyl-1,4-benzoquinol methylase
MSTCKTKQPPRSDVAAFDDDLPDYAEEIAAFHRAFAVELRAVIGQLELAPQTRVLDVGCGDGFYAGLLAERLVAPGRVIGLDCNAAYLQQSRQEFAVRDGRGDVEFVAGTLSNLPFRPGHFDLVWCAQSLYSLPEPVGALRQMAAAVRPGGWIVVLESDTLHQLLLPWPSHLEIALRASEFAAFCDESRRPAKFYVGRCLPAVLAAAGLEPLGFKTQCIDRQAPLDRDLQRFLQAYLERLAKRVGPYLDRSLARQFARLIDPDSGDYLLRQPHFTTSCLNVLAWARRPL